MLAWITSRARVCKGETPKASRIAYTVDPAPSCQSGKGFGLGFVSLQGNMGSDGCDRYDDGPGTNTTINWEKNTTDTLGRAVR